MSVETLYKNMEQLLDGYFREGMLFGASAGGEEGRVKEPQGAAEDKKLTVPKFAALC